MEYALPRLLWCIAVAMAANLAACADTAKLPAGADFGTQAQIVAPHRSLVPTVHIAPAAGWPVGGKPTAAAGTAVGAFAAGLDHPRWLYVLPNGDVLVAETDAPPKPQDQRGFKGWAMKKLMGRAGSGKKSADRITLLRDTRGTGVADTRTVLIDGLHSPFGMALIGDRLYVADSDAVLSFAYVAGETHIAGEGTKVVDLPA